MTMIHLPLHFGLRHSLTFWDSYHCSKIGYFFWPSLLPLKENASWDHPWSQPQDIPWCLWGALCRDWTSQASPMPGLKDEGTNSWVYSPCTRSQWSHYFGGPGLSSRSSQVHASGLLCRHPAPAAPGLWLSWLKQTGFKAQWWDQTSLKLSFFDCEMGEAITTSECKTANLDRHTNHLEILLWCGFRLSESGTRPEIPYFYQAPRWYPCCCQAPTLRAAVS